MTAPRHTSLERVLRRSVATLVLALGVGALVLGVPTSALAHDGLVATSPAGGTTVPAAPAEIEVDFTGEPLPIGTLVAVTGPEGDAVADGDAEIRGTTVVQRLTGDLAAGVYRVDWRSTSSDGHALTGTFDFTVTPTAGRPPAEATATSTDTDPASGTTSTDPAVAPVWLGVGAVVLVGLGAVLVTRVRRRG